MPHYIAYGEGIESDFDFDALLFSEREDRTFIRFDVQRIDRPYILSGSTFKIGKAQGRNIYLSLQGAELTIGIGSFLWFALDVSARAIRCRALTIVPDKLLQYWFLQQILPIFLLWNGSAEFLHGMAVSTQSQSVSGPSASCMAFLGDSHAGKSTLLDYFLSRGHTLVSDDHLALSRQDHLSILPATPFYRPYRAGEDLGIVAKNFSPDPVPLRRLYLLEPALGYADIELQELRGLEAVSALLRHILYNLHNPQASELFPLVAERFRGLSQLVRQVAVKRIYIPRSMQRLAEVYNFIQHDLENPAL